MISTPLTLVTKSEWKCCVRSGLTGTGRCGDAAGAGGHTRWWLTQLCLLTIIHLSSTGHQGQQGRDSPTKSETASSMCQAELHYQPINLPFSSSRL